MERFQRGDVVVAKFIFTDASQTKNRPAVVVAALTDNDYILCPITRRCRQNDPYQVEIRKDDIVGGNLAVDSYIRPNLLMSVNQCLLIWKIGSLPQTKMNEVTRKIIEIITT